MTGSGPSGSLNIEYFPSMNGTIAKDVWQTWTPTSGTWYVRSGCGATQGTYKTFTQIATLCAAYASTATSVATYAWGGSFGEQFLGADEYVDTVQIVLGGTDTTYDFEPGQVSVSDLRKLEGNVGTTSFRFEVSMPVAADADCRFRWRAIDGTATSPIDFAAYEGLEEIGEGEARTKVTVVVAGDRMRERGETFKVRLSRPVNCALGDSLALGTILNDD